MFLLRWLGLALVTVAVLLLISEAMSGFAGQAGFGLKALGEWWFALHPTSLQLLQPAVERHISPALFDPYILMLLEWPAVIEVAVLGAVLWLLGSLGRRRTA